jgi:hypothetical protein
MKESTDLLGSHIENAIRVGGHPPEYYIEVAQTLFKRLGRATVLLREARAAISDEIEAAGPEDVEGHPILKAHRRTLNKVDRFLKIRR